MKKLIEKLAELSGEVPGRADVLVVRQHPVDELQRRARNFLGRFAEATKLPTHRMELVQRKGHTLALMPLGARAVLYHESGAMAVHGGLNPMELLFSKVEERDSLIKLVEKVSASLPIRKWAGDATLRFERLWQIKAAASARDGKPTKPVLCRVIGAYRHFIGELPVLGPASMAVKLASEGRVDTLSLLVRGSTGEVVDHPDVLRPEIAARQIAGQLRALMGKSKINLEEAAKPEWMQFGYLSLPKRKAQRVLAPIYIAAVSIEGQQEAQAYLLGVSATEVAYMPLGAVPIEAPKLRTRVVEPAISEAHRAVA